jgi:putative DNA primase/helicase
MGSLASIGRQLNGQFRRGEWICPCPLGCGYELNLRETPDGNVLAYCLGGHKFAEILPVLIECGLNDIDDVDIDDVDGYDGAIASAGRRLSDKTKIHLARRTYEHFAQAIGTLVQVYLLSRGILIVPEVLRFGWCTHRHFRPERFPVMATLIVDIDGHPIGIHLTYLRFDGSDKIDVADKSDQRECRGKIGGGTIRLAPYEPGRELIIAEGIETTLSAMQIFGLPGWSAVFAGGLKTLELPPEVREIVIAADNDESGIGWDNALAAEERWLAEGRSVRVVIPPVPGTDFNDVLRGRNGRSDR